MEYCYNLHRAGTQTDYISALEPVHTESLQGAGDNQNRKPSQSQRWILNKLLFQWSKERSKWDLYWLTLGMQLYLKLLLNFDRSKSLQLI